MLAGGRGFRGCPTLGWRDGCNCVGSAEVRSSVPVVPLPGGFKLGASASLSDVGWAVLRRFLTVPTESLRRPRTGLVEAGTFDELGETPSEEELSFSLL